MSQKPDTEGFLRGLAELSRAYGIYLDMFDDCGAGIHQTFVSKVPSKSEWADLKYEVFEGLKWVDDHYEEW